MCTVGNLSSMTLKSLKDKEYSNRFCSSLVLCNKATPNLALKTMTAFSLLMNLPPF